MPDGPESEPAMDAIPSRPQAVQVRSQRGVRIALVAWIFVVCLLNLLWVQLNAAPPRSWDDAEYLADSVYTYQPLQRGHLVEFVRRASRPALGVHPPMMKLLPIPMYVLFGTGTRPALYAYTALIPVFCVYVFLLARGVTTSGGAALAAVIVTCLFPLTFGRWRIFMIEFGLAVAAVASQYHLFRCASGRSRCRLHAILAGAFIGWGLLWKVSFPIFVVGPIGYLLFCHLRRRDGSAFRSWAQGLPLVVVVASIVAGPFYLYRIGALWDFFIFNSTPNPLLDKFSLGPVFSPLTVVKYWAAVINGGTSAYLFIVFVALCILQLRRGTLPIGTPERWFIASSALIPLAVLSFHQLKEPRHLFPAFAAFGIIAGAMLNDAVAAISVRQRAAVLAALLVFPVYQFAFLSFDIPWVPAKDIRLGPFVLLFAERESLSLRPANPTHWPVDRIVDLIAANRDDIQGRAPRVRVAGHVPFLDGPVLHYESLLRHGEPLVYSRLFDHSLHPTWWDFVVVVSGPIRKYFEYREPALERLLRDERLPFVAFGSVELPDNLVALLYRASSSESLSARIIGENLVTAVDRRGEELFSVSRAEWHLPAHRGVRVVADKATPIEFAYVFVPESARSLTWQAVRNPQQTCDAYKYAVKVFDLNSSRGATRELSSNFIVTTAEEQAMSLGIEELRGQIVTIQLSDLSQSGTGPCVGWSALRLTGE
jgi:hypothetical protein